MYTMLVATSCEISSELYSDSGDKRCQQKNVINSCKSFDIVDNLCTILSINGTIIIINYICHRELGSSAKVRCGQCEVGHQIQLF